MFLIIFGLFFPSLPLYQIGLCNDCLNQTQRDMPPPTPADLQGFWEMVYLQVENVESLFTDLDRLRANDWKVSVLFFKSSIIQIIGIILLNFRNFLSTNNLQMFRICIKPNRNHLKALN